MRLAGHAGGLAGTTYQVQIEDPGIPCLPRISLLQEGSQVLVVVPRLSPVKDDCDVVPLFTKAWIVWNDGRRYHHRLDEDERAKGQGLRSGTRDGPASHVRSCITM